MKKIIIKVDEELFEKAEARRGAQKRSEFYRKVLIEYLSKKPEEEQNISAHIPAFTKEFEAMRAELSYKDAMIRALKDERIKDMQNQLNFLQLEFQKLSSQIVRIQPDPHKWWQFWK